MFFPQNYESPAPQLKKTSSNRSQSHPVIETPSSTARAQRQASLKEDDEDRIDRRKKKRQEEEKLIEEKALEEQREVETKREAARQAELARQEKLAQEAALERQKELERKAELARKEELERQEAERKAEAERQAELERQEAERKAEEELAKLEAETNKTDITSVSETTPDVLVEEQETAPEAEGAEKPETAPGDEEEVKWTETVTSPGVAEETGPEPVVEEPLSPEAQDTSTTDKIIEEVHDAGIPEEEEQEEEEE